MSAKKILIGSRIPESVIIELREYCKSHGILMNHFVSEAIKTKLKKVKRSEEKEKAEKLPLN
jgi:transposase